MQLALSSDIIIKLYYILNDLADCGPQCKLLYLQTDSNQIALHLNDFTASESQCKLLYLQIKSNQITLHL